MINRVILVGNLGKNPEVRKAQSGNSVTSFSLATSRRFKDGEGNRQEQTEWHSVVCFGRLADVAGQYLTKGRQVYVEGRIQTRSWEDAASGQTRYRTEIVCENLQMLGSREAAPAEPEAAEAAEAAKPKAAQKKTTRRRKSAKKS